MSTIDDEVQVFLVVVNGEGHEFRRPAVTDASDAMRTVFGSKNGKPMQHVRARIHAQVDVHPASCGAQAIRNWLV